jgi:hypothetical protein
MCQAFSCVVDPAGKVTWKLGVDSHSDLARLGGYKDEVLGEFAKIEITPKNRNYLNPDEWVYRVDESPVPKWCGLAEKELCLAAHKKWLKQLEKFINRHPVVHPFEKAPPSIERKHILLLKKWASVRASVRDSVWASVWDSVWASVGDSVWASVRDSVWASVWDSVWASVWASVRDSVWASVWDSVWASVGDSVWASVRDSVWASVWDSVWASVWASVGDSVGDSVWASVRDSVWAYTGSFFRIPVWKYVKHPKGKYPYQPLVTLWNQGLVPSFDGTTWRLHGGPKAAILFSITKAELEKYK